MYNRTVNGTGGSSPEGGDNMEYITTIVIFTFLIIVVLKKR